MGDLAQMYAESWQPGKFETKRRPLIFGYNGDVLIGDPVVVDAREFASILKHWRRQQHAAYEWEEMKEAKWREKLRSETRSIMIKSEKEPKVVEPIMEKKIRKGLLESGF